MIRGILRVDAGSPAEAHVLAAALQVDDGELARCQAEGQHVVVTLDGSTPMGVLRTVDDLLECLRAARPGPAAPKASG